MHVLWQKQHFSTQESLRGVVKSHHQVSFIFVYVDCSKAENLAILILQEIPEKTLFESQGESLDI
jgi:hypothetical protein